MKQNYGMETYEEARRRVEQEVGMEVEGGNLAGREQRNILETRPVEKKWRNYEPRQAHKYLK